MAAPKIGKKDTGVERRICEGIKVKSPGKIQSAKCWRLGNYSFQFVEHPIVPYIASSMDGQFLLSVIEFLCNLSSIKKNKLYYAPYYKMEARDVPRHDKPIVTSPFKS